MYNILIQEKRHLLRQRISKNILFTILEIMNSHYKYHVSIVVVKKQPCIDRTFIYMGICHGEKLISSMLATN